MWSDLRALTAGRSPRQVVVQVTDRCNAACPQCSMRGSMPYTRTRMSCRLGAAIVDHAASLGVSAISFTGGEPLLCLDDVTHLVRRAAAAGIRYTRTGTNGFLLTGVAKPGYHARVARLAERLADSGLRNFWISLDSADATTHETMRGLPGVVLGIGQALPHFHDVGLYPSVNLGLNRAMGTTLVPDLRDAGEEAFRAAAKEALDAFFRRAVDLGFSMANVCYPMSANGGQGVEGSAYLATSESPLVTFTSAEKALLYAALADAVEEHRGSLRIFTPLSSLAALAREHGHGPPGYPCRGGLDYFFVDAHGDAFPCGYRGDENLGPFVRLDPARLSGGEPCRACDWECFRDPSELLGPVTGLSHLSMLPLRRLRRADERTSLWRDDVRYALACGLFDGRRPPDRRRLAQFAQEDGERRDGRESLPGPGPTAPHVAGRRA